MVGPHQKRAPSKMTDLQPPDVLDGIRGARCGVETELARKRRAASRLKSLKSYHLYGFWHSAAC
jgi:hypothetical protein